MTMLEHSLLALGVCLAAVAILFHPRSRLDDSEDEHVTHAGSEAGHIQQQREMK